MKTVIVKSAMIAALALPSLAVASEPEQCLDWTVETHAASSKVSSCAYYMRNKVSTHFIVENRCDSNISGVFSYTREDAVRPLSVQPFEVAPGAVEEVAKPCDEVGYWRVTVSQVSY